MGTACFGTPDGESPRRARLHALGAVARLGDHDGPGIDRNSASRVAAGRQTNRPWRQPDPRRVHVGARRCHAAGADSDDRCDVGIGHHSRAPILLDDRRGQRGGPDRFAIGAALRSRASADHSGDSKRGADPRGQIAGRDRRAQCLGRFGGACGRDPTGDAERSGQRIQPTDPVLPRWHNQHGFGGAVASGSRADHRQDAWHHGRRHRQRRGAESVKRNAFSLLEMILALSILGMSLAILAQLARTGVSAAREARALATARVLCQSKLNEQLLNIQAGQSPATIIDAPIESFDSQSAGSFVYSVEVMPGRLDGLLSLRVAVKALGNNGEETLANYALDRWVIDPLLGLETAEAEELAAREEIASGGAEAGI
ncbi:type II secretion system protein [Roseiconus nitratireducens]|uniref:Type II secretion system protein n=1 Tax=Roseiconus nitratireducens TaxID=2605748 RepID=A0A5M6DBL0_9BACT|nr:type II secretion system protein [Roseiconus nitratireducens]